jgi:hypothetical protein
MMPNKESEILFNLVKLNYQDKLTPKELEEVKKAVEQIVKSSERMRLIQLANWDEPFTVFIPFREE